RVLPARTRLHTILALLDQQPVFRIAVELRRHERPRAVEALSMEPDGQAAVLLLFDQLVGPAVPDLDLTGAVLALRDLALEARVGPIRAARPSAPPNSRARPAARAGSRNAAGAHRAAG